MGGQLWHYFVPHNNDVNAALQRLRKDFFARGDYHKNEAMTPEERQTELDEVRSELGPWLDQTREISKGLPPGLAHVYAGAAEKFRDEMMKEDALSDEPEEKPDTIEELLEMRAESGTWSILDITHISE